MARIKSIIVAVWLLLGFSSFITTIVKFFEDPTWPPDWPQRPVMSTLGVVISLVVVLGGPFALAVFPEPDVEYKTSTGFVYLMVAGLLTFFVYDQAVAREFNPEFTVVVMSVFLAFCTDVFCIAPKPTVVAPA